MDDLMHQVLKEWYWLVIFAALVAVAFAPSFLKGKCPKCNKRKLVSVDLDSSIQEKIRNEHGRGANSFFSFYWCSACGAKLYRDRSGPFQDASADRWETAFAALHDS